MSSSTLALEQKRVLSNPNMGWSWQHATIQPTTGDQHLQIDQTNNLGHDLSRVSTQTTPCPATPTRCPFGGACHTCPVHIQPKLKISQPDDEYEQEADRVAEMVMRMPEPKDDEKEQCNISGCTQILQGQINNEVLVPNEVPSIVHEVLHTPGQPIDAQTRAFMEPRLGYDFSGVRIHRDKKANESAKAINAIAYTVGQDIVIGAGNYRPETLAGRKLIAHELVHVLQQEKAGIPSVPIRQQHDRFGEAAENESQLVTNSSNSAGFSPSIRPIVFPRAESPISSLQRRQEETNPDTRADDPNFLLCSILCYLGIPPAIWKSAVELLLRAVWEEYRDTYEAARAESEFRSYREEFRLYGAAKVFKLILTFAIQGKIGLIPIRTTAARALQKRITEFLISRGATAAGLAIAEQVARKVVLAIEVVFAAGCAAYCAGLAFARTITEATTAVVEGISATLNIISAIAEGIGRGIVGEIIIRPLLVVLATMDPTNWDLSPLPTKTQRDLNVLGFWLHARGEPDKLDRFITKPFSAYPIPAALIRDVVQGMSETSSRQTGFDIVFTPEIFLQLTPFAFVQLLKDWHLLNFRKDPERLADEGVSSGKQ